MEDQRWDSQIQKVLSKANITLGFLGWNLKVRSRTLKERAYTAIVRPSLEYACSAWDLYTATHIHKLDAVQRRAAQWVVSRYRQTCSVTAILQDLN